MMYSNPHELSLKSLDDSGFFQGYASVFNVLDDHGDRIKRGAFEKTLKTWKTRKTWPKMLWQHDVQTPIGQWKSIKEDDHGLFVEGQLLLDLQKGREAHTLLKAGAVDHLSIGFYVRQSTKGTEKNERILTEIDLHEVSLVTFAANTEAKITHVKSRLGEGRTIIETLHRASLILSNTY